MGQPAISFATNATSAPPHHRNSSTKQTCSLFCIQQNWCTGPGAHSPTSLHSIRRALPNKNRNHLLHVQTYLLWERRRRRNLRFLEPGPLRSLCSKRAGTLGAKRRAATYRTYVHLGPSASFQTRNVQVSVPCHKGFSTTRIVLGAPHTSTKKQDLLDT